MPYRTRRCTGLSPSRTSGRARATMTDIAQSRNLERISCSSSRGSIRPGPSAPVSTSDIEEGVLRVLLDEDSARLDLVAHQHREELVGSTGVLDLDAHERGRVGGQRGLPT